jgi:type I restriction enzyme S subunit
MTKQESWMEATLEDCMEAIIDYRGKTPKKKRSGIPLITAKVIKEGRIEPATEFIDPDDYNDWMTRGLPSTGDVLLTTEAPLGEVAQLSTSDVALAQRVITLRGKQGVLNNSFLKYLLRTAFVQEQLKSRASGSTVSGIKQSELRKVLLRFPSYTEQVRIASILGSLDDKIELNRRMNATLESMAQAIFKSWFIDFDPVHRNAAACSGQSYESIAEAILQPETFDNLFPGSFSESKLGLIPSGWSITAISDFVELQRGKTYKSRLKDLPGPYLLGLGSIERNGGFRSDKLATYGGDSPDNLLVNPGDLYVSLKDVTQSAHLLGAVARFPKQFKLGRLTQDTVKLILMPDTVSPSILYHFLLLPEYREYCRSHATGTTNLGLAREDFLSYLVVKPSKNVQDAFDEITNQIDDRIKNNDTESQALTVLRDELLSQLLCECLRQHSTQNPTLANH